MTDFNVVCPDISRGMNDAELQRFILFSVAVAGKTANTIARQLEDFLALEQNGATPFQKVGYMVVKGQLLRNLRMARLGRYQVLRRAYRELVASDLNLRTCTVWELEEIHGIGPKTARFFLTYSRPGQQFAILDTHILKFITRYGKCVGYLDPVPKSTPSGRRYQQLEEVFLKLATLVGKTPADLDTLIWMDYSSNGGIDFKNAVKTLMEV